MKELLGLYEKFVNEKKGTEGIQQFVLWLNKELFFTTDTKDQHDLETQIPFLISIINKRYKGMVKEVLADSEVSNADSYSFLYHLFMVDSFRKMEIVEIHEIPAPSGIEILKRLLTKGLIEEFDDPRDKRAKRVRISSKGKLEIENLAPRMAQLNEQFSQILGQQKKLQLIALLQSIYTQ